MATRFKAPDVLVLGVGGVLGEAWLRALLAGLKRGAGFDARDCQSFVGSSAGSIVAASLVAGRAPEGPADAAEPMQPAPEPEARSPLGRLAGVGAAAAAPLVAAGLSATVPATALMRRLALARVPDGRRSLDGLGERLDRAGASFDGRLTVAAVELETGRRVLFGRTGAPEASVGRAVEASCAIPGWFRPVSIGAHRYVDGGAWSPTNLDAADVSHGTRVLCLNPTASMPVFGPLSRAAAAVETLLLERRGARVRTVAPDRESARAIGANAMNPGPRDRVASAGYEQGLRLAGEA